MARSLQGNSADLYCCKIKRNHPLVVHITWLKKIMQLNDENACQTNTYQVSHTRPTTLKFSQLPLAPNGEGLSVRVLRLQLFLEQLLVDIW